MMRAYRAKARGHAQSAHDSHAIVAHPKFFSAKKLMPAIARVCASARVSRGCSRFSEAEAYQVAAVPLPKWNAFCEAGL
jgi:uncharacterized protein YciW